MCCNKVLFVKQIVFFPACGMEVEVQGLSGNLLCCLEVQAAQTVADLKELIHKATHIKTNLQKLLLGNELLRNTDSCGEILTQGANHIRLVVIG